MNKGVLKKLKLVLLALFLHFSSFGQLVDQSVFEFLNDRFVSREYFEQSNRAHDLMQQSDQNAIANLGSNYEMLQGQINALQSGFEHLNSLINVAQGAVDLYASMRTLDNAECAPDFALSGDALMPSSCLDPQNRNAEGCQGCFSAAHESLQSVRRGMARMRCIYQNTKNFTQKALSFGDNIAGLHGAMGMTWQGQRRGIEQSYQRFTQSYDRKYADFIASLHETLLGVNNCENQFGTRDWYQRFGFMFEEIMKEKYKRTD